jgi:hypothetical protein
LVKNFLFEHCVRFAERCPASWIGLTASCLLAAVLLATLALWPGTDDRPAPASRLISQCESGLTPGEGCRLLPM